MYHMFSSSALFAVDLMGLGIYWAMMMLQLIIGHGCRAILH